MSYENDVIKVKYQFYDDNMVNLVNAVSMIIYDDNGKPIKFDDESSEDSRSNINLYLEPEK